jgi:phosphatidylserine/phosphatidylglycerophosphate/cardiolipin synthase-like enzyme
LRTKRQTTNALRNPFIAGALILVFIIYLVQLIYTKKNQPPTQELSGVITEVFSTALPSANTEQPVSNPAIEVFFTDPVAPNADKLIGGPDEQLAAAINQAQTSVDMAMYNLSLKSITDALLNAHKRSVKVRMVMESDSLSNERPQQLKDAGIPIIGDGHETLMHNKFTIIDGQEVWTGSLNLTVDGTYKDNNNLVRIRSTHFAKNYTNEFEKMFTRDKFGQDKISDTPYPVLTIDGKRVEVYFSPQDGVLQHLVNLVNSSKSSIYFLAYTFTSDPLANAMMNRSKAGVELQGVFEEQQANNSGTEYDRFIKAGTNIRLDSNPGLMHHKVIIFDGQYVALGSYNFTRAAEEGNDENLLIIYDKDIASKFTQEFYKIFNNSK